MRKKCLSCGNIRDGSKFRHKNKLRNNTKLKAVCLPCERIQDKNREHTLQRRYSHYKSRAKTDRRTFSIDLEQFKRITNKSCSYCGKYSDSAHGELFCGIDRIDSYKGYIKNNIVPCCGTCNVMKSSLTYTEFVNHIKKIAGNLKLLKG